MPISIVSGGQTGADRGALDAALASGVPCGGYCPRGRRAEDGPIPERYGGLVETESEDPAQRTERNVRDSDATLILSWGTPLGGTALTERLARRFDMPVLVVDLEPIPPDAAAAAIREWLAATRPRVLNVAGPRQSQAPGIAAAATAVLRSALCGEASGQGGAVDSRNPSSPGPDRASARCRAS